RCGGRAGCGYVLAGKFAQSELLGCCAAAPRQASARPTRTLPHIRSPRRRSWRVRAPIRGPNRPARAGDRLAPRARARSAVSSERAGSFGFARARLRRTLRLSRTTGAFVHDPGRGMLHSAATAGVCLSHAVLWWLEWRGSGVVDAEDVGGGAPEDLVLF